MEFKKTIPSDFELHIYKELNSDICHMSDDDILKHYVDYGRFENRKYKYTHVKSNFDFRIYLLLNPDVTLPDNISAKKHYDSYGYHENRKYYFENLYVHQKTYDNFDWEKYADTYNYHGYSKKELFFHWNNFGKFNYYNYFNKNQKYVKKCYVISIFLGGGSSKYMFDLINRYIYIEFIFIKKINGVNISIGDIIFVQYLNNINIDEIIQIKKQTQCILYLTVHDNYWLTYNTNTHKYNTFKNNNMHSKYLYDDVHIDQNVIKLFNNCDKIFHPSKFTYDIYKKYFSCENFKLIGHNDIYINLTKIHIPKIHNKIRIGCMHHLTECKGKKFIDYLMETIKSHGNYEIEWIFPKYTENTFYHTIQKHKINCLVFLNFYGETWCYALSKGLQSGLPIIYNNFGSFKERIPNKPQYFKVYENEVDVDNDVNNTHITNKFKQIIDYIIKNNGYTTKSCVKKNNRYSYDEIFKV